MTLTNKCLCLGTNDISALILYWIDECSNTKPEFNFLFRDLFLIDDGTNDKFGAQAIEETDLSVFLTYEFVRP